STDSLLVWYIRFSLSLTTSSPMNEGKEIVACPTGGCHLFAPCKQVRPTLVLHYIRCQLRLIFKHMLEVLLVLLHMANHTSKGLFIGDRCMRVHLKVLNPCHLHTTLNRLIEPGEMHVEKWELGCASLGNGYSFLEIQNT